MCFCSLGCGIKVNRKKKQLFKIPVMFCAKTRAYNSPHHFEGRHVFCNVCVCVYDAGLCLSIHPHADKKNSTDHPWNHWPLICTIFVNTLLDFCRCKHTWCTVSLLQRHRWTDIGLVHSASSTVILKVLCGAFVYGWEFRSMCGCVFACTCALCIGKK